MLGDWWRGALPADMPPALGQSVRLHRRIDATTDRHPAVQAARARFAPGARRYAGVVLDLLYDHLLAQTWARYSREPLAAFAERAAQAAVAEAAWFAAAGGPVPRREGLSALLTSYASAGGFEQALRRTALRLRRPQGLIAAAQDWRGHLPRLGDELPLLLAALRAAAADFTRSADAR